MSLYIPWLLHQIQEEDQQEEDLRRSTNREKFHSLLRNVFFTLDEDGDGLVATNVIYNAFGALCEDAADIMEEGIPISFPPPPHLLKCDHPLTKAAGRTPSSNTRKPSSFNLPQERRGEKEEDEETTGLVQHLESLYTSQIEPSVDLFGFIQWFKAETGIVEDARMFTEEEKKANQVSGDNGLGGERYNHQSSSPQDYLPLPMGTASDPYAFVSEQETATKRGEESSRTGRLQEYLGRCEYLVQRRLSSAPPHHNDDPSHSLWSTPTVLSNREVLFLLELFQTRLDRSGKGYVNESELAERLWECLVVECRDRSSSEEEGGENPPATVSSSASLPNHTGGDVDEKEEKKSTFSQLVNQLCRPTHDANDDPHLNNHNDSSSQTHNFFFSVRRKILRHLLMLSRRILEQHNTHPIFEMDSFSHLYPKNSQGVDTNGGHERPVMTFSSFILSLLSGQSILPPQLLLLSTNSSHQEPLSHNTTRDGNLLDTTADATWREDPSFSLYAPPSAYCSAEEEVPNPFWISPFEVSSVSELLIGYAHQLSCFSPSSLPTPPLEEKARQLSERRRGRGSSLPSHSPSPTPWNTNDRETVERDVAFIKPEELERLLRLDMPLIFPFPHHKSGHRTMERLIDSVVTFAKEKVLYNPAEMTRVTTNDVHESSHFHGIYLDELIELYCQDPFQVLNYAPTQDAAPPAWTLWNLSNRIQLCIRQIRRWLPYALQRQLCELLLTLRRPRGGSDHCEESFHLSLMDLASLQSTIPSFIGFIHPHGRREKAGQCASSPLFPPAAPSSLLLDTNKQEWEANFESCVESIARLVVAAAEPSWLPRKEGQSMLTLDAFIQQLTIEVYWREPPNFILMTPTFKKKEEEAAAAKGGIRRYIGLPKIRRISVYEQEKIRKRILAFCNVHSSEGLLLDCILEEWIASVLIDPSIVHHQHDDDDYNNNSSGNINSRSLLFLGYMPSAGAQCVEYLAELLVASSSEAPRTGGGRNNYLFCEERYWLMKSVSIHFFELLQKLILLHYNDNSTHTGTGDGGSNGHSYSNGNSFYKYLLNPAHTVEKKVKFLKKICLDRITNHQYVNYQNGPVGDSDPVRQSDTPSKKDTFFDLLFDAIENDYPLDKMETEASPSFDTGTTHLESEPLPEEAVKRAFKERSEVRLNHINILRDRADFAIQYFYALFYARGEVHPIHSNDSHHHSGGGGDGNDILTQISRKLCEIPNCSPWSHHRENGPGPKRIVWDLEVAHDALKDLFCIVLPFPASQLSDPAHDENEDEVKKTEVNHSSTDSRRLNHKALQVYVHSFVNDFLFSAGRIVESPNRDARDQHTVYVDVTVLVLRWLSWFPIMSIDALLPSKSSETTEDEGPCLYFPLFSYSTTPGGKDHVDDDKDNNNNDDDDDGGEEWRREKETLHSLLLDVKRLEEIELEMEPPSTCCSHSPLVSLARLKTLLYLEEKDRRRVLFPRYRLPLPPDGSASFSTTTVDPQGIGIQYQLYLFFLSVMRLTQSNCACCGSRKRVGEVEVVTGPTLSALRDGPLTSQGLERDDGCFLRLPLYLVKRTMEWGPQQQQLDYYYCYEWRYHSLLYSKLLSMSFPVEVQYQLVQYLKPSMDSTPPTQWSSLILLAYKQFLYTSGSRSSYSSSPPRSSLLVVAGCGGLDYSYHTIDGRETVQDKIVYYEQFPQPHVEGKKDPEVSPPPLTRVQQERKEEKERTGVNKENRVPRRPDRRRLQPVEFHNRKNNTIIRNVTNNNNNNNSNTSTVLKAEEKKVFIPPEKEKKRSSSKDSPLLPYVAVYREYSGSNSRSNSK